MAVRVFQPGDSIRVPPRQRPNPYAGPLSVSTPIKLETETGLWRDAVVTNGGSVSDYRLLVMNQFILAEKNAGCWALTDDYWMLCAETEIQALTSLKQLRLAAVANAPTFTADRGYTFDGATNYIDTNFNPSTMCVAATATNVGAAFYSRTNVTAATAAFGGSTSSTTAIILRPKVTGTDAFTVQMTSNARGFVVTDSLGLLAASRALDSLTIKGWKRGVALTDPANATAGTALPNLDLAIGATNTSGTPGSFWAGTGGFARINAPMTTAQELANYNNVQSFMSALGANV